MSMTARLAFLLVVLLVLVECRPQDDPFSLETVLGQAGGIGLTLRSSFLSFSRAISEQFEDIFSSTWKAGTEGLKQLNTAIKDTAAETVEGVHETADSVRTFLGNSSRLVGKMATEVMEGGSELVQNATETAEEFLSEVGKGMVFNAVRSGGPVAEFVQEIFNNTVDLINSTNEIFGGAIKRSFENLGNNDYF